MRKVILCMILMLVLAGCGEIAGYPLHDANGRLTCPTGQVLDATDSGIPICRY